MKLKQYEIIPDMHCQTCSGWGELLDNYSGFIPCPDCLTLKDKDGPYYDAVRMVRKALHSMDARKVLESFANIHPCPYCQQVKSRSYCVCRITAQIIKTYNTYSTSNFRIINNDMKHLQPALFNSFFHNDTVLQDENVVRIGNMMYSFMAEMSKPTPYSPEYADSCYMMFNWIQRGRSGLVVDFTNMQKYVWDRYNKKESVYTFDRSLLEIDCLILVAVPSKLKGAQTWKDDGIQRIQNIIRNRSIEGLQTGILIDGKVDDFLKQYDIDGTYLGEWVR